MLYWTVFAPNGNTAVPAEGNGDLQTLICVLVVRPRRCPTLSNPVSWQNWMAAYLGYTLRMKTLFRGWQIMVNDTHTSYTTSSQHARPSGVLRRRSDGLECAAWRPPRPVAQCRQFPQDAKDASVSECTWTLSALEALRNVLYKFKTYFLTYLLTKKKHWLHEGGTCLPARYTYRPFSRAR